MNGLDDNSIDLIIADPPYNLNKNFGNDSDNWDTVEEWFDWSKKWIDESVRILKNNGSIFIYGIHHFLCYIHIYLYDKNLKYRRQFIWHYENGFSTYKNSPAATYEPILWFSKSDEYTYHP
ncbi:MAG: DNA methyltransferase, partial [Candidatus Methanoperedens sp.]|nr:DNA methyltransferase [Candidatus Methanoperedens sp.]